MNIEKNIFLKAKNILFCNSTVQNINLPAKSSIIYTSINFLAKGAALIFTPIFTRLLTAAEYGEYSLFASYLSVTLAIGSLELSGGVITRAYQKWRSLGNVTFLIASVICFLVCAPLCLIVFATKQTSSGGLTFPYAYLFLFLSTVSSTVLNLYLSKCRFLYKWLPSLIATVIQSILAPLLSIFMIELASVRNMNHVGAKIGTLSTALTAMATVIAVYAIFLAKKEISASHLGKKELFKFIKECSVFLLRLSLPLLPYYFSVMAISQSDKLIISHALGNDNLGKYSVAYSAGIALTAISGGIMGALSPWLMRKVRANEFGIIKKVLDTFISLCAILIICFNSILPELFNILAPIEYQSAISVTFVITLVPIMLSISQCMSSIAIAKEQTLTILVCGIIPAAVAITLNLIFIPKSPLIVPALISASAYLILSLCNLINIRRLCGIFPISCGVAARNFLLLATVSTALCVFRGVFLFRIIICASGLSALYLKAKSSLSLFSESKSDKSQS